MCTIPTEFSDSPYTISSGSDVSYGVHLDGDVYDLSSYIVGFSYGNIHSPYTDYTGYACFVNSYGSGDYDAWEDSYGQADYWWLRSPDARSIGHGNAYCVILYGNVGYYGVGSSYGNYSPGLFKTSTFYQNTIWTDGTIHGHDRFNNITDSYGVMKYSYVFPGKC